MFRIFKTFKLGPLNITLSPKGIGYTVGAGGVRVGKTATGRTVTRTRVGGVQMSKYGNRKNKR